MIFILTFFSCYSIGFAHIGRVGSVFVTVSVSLERYLSVKKPNTNYSFKKFLLPLSIAFAILYNLPKFFEFVSCNHEVDIPNQPLQISSLYETKEMMTSQKMNSDIPIFPNKTNPFPIKWENDSHQMKKHLNDIVSRIYSNKQNLSRKSVDSVDCKNKLYGITKLRKNRWYIILYVFGSEVIFVEMFPWITIIILNVLTWKGIQEFERNRKRLVRNHSLGL